MPQRITFEGQIHEFPDDFTDADIAAALKMSGTNKPSSQENSPPIHPSVKQGVLSMLMQGATPAVNYGIDQVKDAALHPLRTIGEIGMGKIGLNAIRNSPSISTLAKTFNSGSGNLRMLLNQGFEDLATAGRSVSSGANSAAGALAGAAGEGLSNLLPLVLDPRQLQDIQRQILLQHLGSTPNSKDPS